jgi:hypothetical protein
MGDSAAHRLAEHLLDHVAVHIGQPVIPALEAERQPAVIEA